VYFNTITEVVTIVRVLNVIIKSPIELMTYHIQLKLPHTGNNIMKNVSLINQICDVILPKRGVSPVEIHVLMKRNNSFQQYKDSVLYLIDDVLVTFNTAPTIPNNP